jgi:hypothetical protein
VTAAAAVTVRALYSKFPITIDLLKQHNHSDISSHTHHLLPLICSPILRPRPPALLCCIPATGGGQAKGGSICCCRNTQVSLAAVNKQYGGRPALLFPSCEGFGGCECTRSALHWWLLLPLLMWQRL